MDSSCHASLGDLIPDPPPLRAGIRPIPIHPDSDRFPYQVCFWHESYAIVTTVATVVAVVSHQEVVAFRDLESAFPAESSRRNQDLVGVIVKNLGAQMQPGPPVTIEESVDLEGGRATIYGELLVAVLDRVARQSDDSLDVIRLRIRRQ